MRCCSSLMKRRCWVSLTSNSLPGPYVERASSASSCMKSDRNRPLSIVGSSPKYCTSEWMFMPGLRREKVDRLGCGQRLDILLLELEELDACDQLALKVGILQLARED